MADTMAWADPDRLQRAWLERLKLIEVAQSLGGLIETPRFDNCDDTDRCEDALTDNCGGFDALDR
jgi:hypothetical protein